MKLINSARCASRLRSYDVIPGIWEFLARLRFNGIKEFVISDARVCKGRSRWRLLASSNRIRTTDTCVVLYISRETPARAKRVSSPRLPLRTRRETATFCQSRTFRLSSFLFLVLLLSFCPRWFSRGFASMRVAGAVPAHLCFCDAGDARSTRCPSTSGAIYFECVPTNSHADVPHANVFLARVAFSLSLSLSPKRSAARDGVH